MADSSTSKQEPFPWDEKARRRRLLAAIGDFTAKGKPRRHPRRAKRPRIDK